MESAINSVVMPLSKAHSIRWKLSISYALYAFILLLFVGFLSNIIIKNQFQAYAKTRQQNHISHIISVISNQYMDGWNEKNIEVIGKQEIDNGYVVSVYDMNNEVVWDALHYNNYHCLQIIEEIEVRMNQKYPEWEGKYITKDYPLNYQNERVGTIRIGSFYPYFYTETDLTFLMTLNTIYIVLSMIFIFIAIILGAYMAKRLSRPLVGMVSATSNIIKGKYDKIPDDPSKIKEIDELISSINKLTFSLKSQEALRKQLTSDITHELRTPLTTLQSHIEAMIDGVLDTDRAQLQNIYEEIIRLNSIVNDLQKLMHYDVEDILLNKELINISDIIKNIVGIFKAQFISKNVEINYKLEEAFLLIDKDKIHQVFINLLSNALKYTPSDKSVFIEVQNKPKEVIIIVRDTGIGISEKDLPHIFERFYRADESRNRKTGGAGIGLAIVKSIITAHNGTITVDSKIGVFTEFTIILPK